MEEEPKSNICDLIVNKEVDICNDEELKTGYF